MDDHFTTGNRLLAECPELCQVLSIDHLAKKLCAQCFPKNSWQTINIRKINLLPSVTWEALGKEEHVPHTCDGHAMAGAPPWQLLVLLPSARNRHSAKLGFPCAIFLHTWQTWSSAECLLGHTANCWKENHHWPPNFFCCSHTTHVTTCSNMVYLSISLLYLVN